MGQCSPLPSMLRSWCHGQVRGPRNGLYSADMDSVLFHTGKTDTVAIDIVPRFCRIEREFIWHNANNWSIFVMETLVLKGNAAA